MFGKNKYRYRDFVYLFYKFTPLTAILKTLHYIIMFTFPTLRIILTAYFVDTAVMIAGEHGDKINDIIHPVALLLLLMLYEFFAQNGIKLLMRRAENKVNLIVQSEIVSRVTKTKFRYFENQDTLDVIFRAVNNFSLRVMEMPETIFDLLSSLFSVFGFIIVLGTQLWWSAVFLALLSVPIYIIACKSGKKKYDIDRKLTKIDRKVGYINELLTGRHTVDERYMFGYENKLSSDYKREYEYARIERKKSERRRFISMRSISDIIALSSVVIIGLLIQPTVAGDITIGMFTSLAVSVFPLGDMLSWVLPAHVLRFRMFFEYVKDINIFLSYEIEDGLIDLPAESHPQLDTVEFRHVSFKYPGTDEYTLENMSFTLHSGKHYAIVGANGAGKTTIAKLLAGLYEEYKGDIYINGCNLKEYTPSEKMALVAVVFQDFARFPIDLHDNIALGDILNMDNTSAVKSAVYALGLTNIVEKLPDGLKTPLTKIKKNGVDLSGGEWQRIALARLIVNPSPLKILDEPTAALDPVAESRVYEQFGKITDKVKYPNNIVIFISHRLGSTKLADEILVISDGVIAEQGTFRELLSKNGIFAEMYNTQAEWYKEIV